MKTKLLTRLRNEAHQRIGVFKFSDGKYRVVFDKTFFGDLSLFDEERWKELKGASSFQVFNEPDEICGTIQEAKPICDHYRREFILREVRKMRFGSTNGDRRYY